MDIKIFDIWEHDLIAIPLRQVIINKLAATQRSSMDIVLEWLDQVGYFKRQEDKISPAQHAFTVYDLLHERLQDYHNYHNWAFPKVPSESIAICALLHEVHRFESPTPNNPAETLLKWIALTPIEIELFGYRCRTLLTVLLRHCDLEACYLASISR